MGNILIGTAGWSIPRAAADRFPAEGSGLERYAARFPVLEINSSFHRPHRPATWERWRDSVPDGFRFSVKLPKTVTHERKLVDCRQPVADFMGQAGALGAKLAVVLVQLPPKLEFDGATAGAFFEMLGSLCPANLACEPRNASWFTPEAEDLLVEQRVCRVAADPARCDGADKPGGWQGLSYWRLHGSPRMYRSSYADRIGAYARALREESAGRETWCIFDNTASGAAASDALALMEALGA